MKNPRLLLLALFLLFLGCRESDEIVAVNYHPQGAMEYCTVSLQACYVPDRDPLFGYMSLAVFLDEGCTIPWRAFGGNNVCWPTAWHMRVPTECWLVVFCDAELFPMQVPEGMTFETAWDGLPEYGDPYHPEILGVDGEPRVHYHFELGDFDDTHLWGIGAVPH